MTSSSTAATLSSTSISGLGLSGLSSGLDTSGIITKLMAIEQGPQTQLKSQLSALQTHKSALQSLNTAAAAIATAAKSVTGANALASFTTSSSSSAVSVTASSSAQAGTVSFTVDSLAAAQTSVTDAMTTWPDTSSATPTITIQVGAKKTAVTASSTNLDDVVAAINKSGTGVTATKITYTANGATQTRLQLTGPTGAANGFSIFEGDTSSTTALPLTTITPAADAQVTLYKGTAAEIVKTSTSNTFKDLLSGVNATVSETSAAPVKVTVAADSTAASASAQALTSSLISLFSGIASSTAITTSSSTTGGTSSSATSGSVFTGDSGVRGFKDALLSAISGSTDGISTSSIGITLTKDGTITFDQSKFGSAMAADPAGTLATYQKIASSVYKVANSASDPVTGSLTARITSETGQQSSLSTKITEWDTRLAVIQQQYQVQFNAMETALNTLSSQAGYLTNQISTLTTNYQNAK